MYRYSRLVDNIFLFVEVFYVLDLWKKCRCEDVEGFVLFWFFFNEKLLGFIR